MSSESFENLSYEDRTFPPSDLFIKNANAKSDIYDEANKDRLAFGKSKQTDYIGIKNGFRLLIGNYPLLNGLLVAN